MKKNKRFFFIEKKKHCCGPQCFVKVSIKKLLCLLVFFLNLNRKLGLVSLISFLAINPPFLAK
jgi:hypothetical protein